MADMDAEMAFLNSMQALNEAAGDYSANGVASADHTKSVSTEDNDHLQPLKETSAPALADDNGEASHIPSLSAVSPSQNLQSPSGSYQSPAALAGTPDAPAASTRSSLDVSDPVQMPSADPRLNTQSTARPRTIAGFSVDDDDDDSDDKAGLMGVIGGVSSTPSVGSTTNGVPFASAQARLSPLTSAPEIPLSNEDASGTSSDMHLSRAAATGVALTGAPANETATPANDATAPPSRDGAAQPASGDPAAAELDEVSATTTKARLPHDRVGILEDRIKEDPRGDLDAWLSLINEHRRRNKLPEARAVYERFFKVFPTAAEQWVAYANMELANNDFYRVEQIFNRILLQMPNLQLWSLYLDYVRRRNNLITDTTGTARTVLSQAFDFVLQNVGIDKDSGRIWQDYIQFLRSGPGVVGGSNWQDQQKMDQLRKAYQRAICIPTSVVNALWKEYDSFEMGLNKMTGRKFLQEKSPAYMTARSSATELDNITRGLHRTTLAVLPPPPGFEGDEEYLRQVELWKSWIRWEKDDPLVLKDEDAAAYKARVVYVFKQAVMALRFWPEVWFEAAEFCFKNELEKDGNDFLSQGIVANPESCLLAFKRADRLESAASTDESEEGVKRRGATVREPYDKLLDALYDLIAKAKAREAQDMARVEENFANRKAEADRGASDDEDERENDAEAMEAAKKAQIKMVQEGSAVQIRILSKTISYSWIALMRAMRRIQGKGKVGDPIGGSRQIFTDARKRGRLTSDVYVASALIEYHCYKDPAATKIFERGLKLFPEDEGLALEYLKHLIAINDITNARAVFETTVSRLGQKPETLPKAKPIYAYFHEYESQYGELSQISKLEKRMATLFPDDPKLAHFSRRFAHRGFDPTALRPIISPATQTRPKSIAPPPPIEPAPMTTTTQRTSPRPAMDRGASPKRYLAPDDAEYESGRPRKISRGESPLKGAAGRRLDQQKRNQQQYHASSRQGGALHHPLPPAPLPRDIAYLLSIIPRAETYAPAPRFKPEEMVRLLRDINLPNQPPLRSRPPPPPPPPPPMSLPPGFPQGLYPFGR